MPKFLLDACISHKFLPLMREIGMDVIHLKDVFPQDTPDDTIISYVAENGYVLLTYDRKMRRAHATALNSYSPQVVFLTKNLGKKKLEEQTEWYRTTWASCLVTLNSISFKQVSVTWNGDVSEVQIEEIFSDESVY